VTSSQKKNVFVVGLILIAVCYSVIVFVNASTSRAGGHPMKSIENLVFLNTDSLPIQPFNRESKSFIFIYFNTTCESCQYEAREIAQSLAMFKTADIILFSSEPLNLIREFSAVYRLKNLKHMTVAKVDGVKVVESLGSIPIPSILIYDRHRVLLKEFNGETKLERLLEALQ
jgi:hypothetical protein